MLHPTPHDFDLVLIDYFLHICAAGSISAAAKRAHLGQSTLSEAMSRLERMLGVRLFLRGRQGIILTQAGAHLKAEGEKIMQQCAQLRQAVQAYADAAGHVSLAMTPSLSLLAGVNLVETLSADYPDIRLQMAEVLSGDIIARLREGRLDLGLAYDVGDANDLDVRQVYQEPMFLISSPDFLTTPEDVELHDLPHWHFVFPSRSQPARGALDRQLRTRGVILPHVSDLDSHSQIVGMLARASACTILPKAPVLRELAEGSLIATPIVGGDFWRSCCLVRPRHQVVSGASIAVEQVLYTILREACQRYALDFRFS